MSINYTPPPGRPQSVPPMDDKPVRDKNWRVRAGHALAARRKADPEFNALCSRRMSEGQISANIKKRKILADECDALNQTETDGRWFTLQTLELLTRWPQSTCHDYAMKHRVKQANMGRMYRFLLPHDKVPGFAAPTPRRGRPLAAVPTPVSVPTPAPVAKPRFGRHIIEIPPEDVEQLLRVELGGNWEFEWPRVTIIAKEPRR